MTLPDLSMYGLLCLGSVMALALVVWLAALLHPLTASHARAVALRAYGVLQKWGPVLLAFVGLAGVALAVERWLRGGDIEPEPPEPLPDPVPSSDEARKVIREETRLEVERIRTLPEDEIDRLVREAIAEDDRA